MEHWDRFIAIVGRIKQKLRIDSVQTYAALDRANDYIDKKVQRAHAAEARYVAAETALAEAKATIEGLKARQCTEAERAELEASKAFSSHDLAVSAGLAAPRVFVGTEDLRAQSDATMKWAKAVLARRAEAKNG